MARKEKLTLDYFPHYAVQGDISKIIQERYGNDGYAVLYKNYEQFCLRDRQYIDLNEYVTLAAISAYCKVTEEKYIKIVDTLVNLGAYDKELWINNKILISAKFLENTKDAYRKRTSESINFQELKNNFRKKLTSNGISTAGNQQIKLNQIKVKENNIISLSNNSKNFGKRERKFLKSYCKRNQVKNTNAYMRKVIDNGDWVQLVKEEKEHQCKTKELKRQIEEQKRKEQEELSEVLPAEKAQEIFVKVRDKLRRGEK